MIRRKIIVSWHKRIGISISLIIILISLTGIALNHSVSLKLDQRIINSELIYKLYDIGSNSSPISYKVENKVLSYLEGSLFLDYKKIGEIFGITGALFSSDIIIVASNNEIQLYTIEGELVERLSSAALPSGSIQRIAKNTDDKVILIMDSGNYIEDARMLRWKPLPDLINFESSNPIESPNNISERLISSYRGNGLSLYRIILDLHSGRLFGDLGVLIFDLAAIGLILLTISGCVLWYRVFKRHRAVKNSASHWEI